MVGRDLEMSVSPHVILSPGAECSFDSKSPPQWFYKLFATVNMDGVHECLQVVPTTWMTQKNVLRTHIPATIPTKYPSLFHQKNWDFHRSVFLIASQITYQLKMKHTVQKKKVIYFLKSPSFSNIKLHYFTSIYN